MGLNFAGIKFRGLPHPRNLEISRRFNFANGLLSDFSRGFNFADGEFGIFLIFASMGSNLTFSIPRYT